LARRGGNVSRDIRVEFSGRARPESRDFSGEIEEQAYREGEAALARAVEFLQNDAGTPHFAFFPYRYLLVVLARFFAHFPEPVPRNRVLLRRWFWRAALIGPGPFNSSWTRALDTLASLIKADDETGSVQRLLSSLGSQGLPSPNLAGFRTNTASGRIILAALWALNPRSPDTGEVYDRQKLTEALQEDSTPARVAQRIFSREPEDKRLWIANRLLVLEDKDDLPEALADLLVNPPIWRINHETEFLASHALDGAMIDALSEKDKSSFLESRRQCIEQVVKDFMERMVEADLEDIPSLDSFDLDEPEEERDDALVE